MKDKLVTILMVLLLISSVLIIIVQIRQINATSSSTEIREVSKAVRLTNSHFYDRNPSFFKAQDGTYWLFYTEGETDPTTPGYDPDSDTYDIYYMISSDNGTTWPTLSLLDLSDPWPSERDVAAFQSSNGTIWVFSGSGFGPGSDNVLRYYTYNSTTWTGPTLVTSGGSNVTGGHVDAFEGSAGRIWVFYEKSGPHTYAIYTDDGGASWSAEVKVNSGSIYGGVPKAFKDSSEMLNVVYTNNGNGIYRANSTDGITWTQSATPIANSSVYDYDPALCQDANGTYWLFWAPWNSTTDSQWLECVHSSDGSTWSDSIHVTSGGYGVSYWWDMWPEAFQEPGGDMLIFYTSEMGNGSYVKGDGNIWMFKVIWNLTRPHYEFIQTTIDASSSSDIINVYPGTYDEQIIINKDNLTIQSVDGAANTIIDGGGDWGPAVHIQLDNVTLQGFTIKNFKANETYGLGGVLVEGDNSRISRNIIENIFNCTTAPAGIGIDVHAKDVQITNSIVHDVGSIGIRVRDHWKEEFLGPTGVSNNVLIENNTVYRTNNTGVLVTGYAKAVTIRNNEIYESLEPTPYSLFVHYNSSDVIIENNHIHDSLYSNIVLAGCDNVTISGNNITGAPTWLSPGKNIYILNDYGDWTGDPTLLSTNINITNNNIKNGGYGVRLLYTAESGDATPMASTTTINYNNIVGNSEYGVENTIAGTEVDARLNWWGNATGPYHPITNPSGAGDNVSDNVDYKPWLIKSYPPATPAPELYVDSVTIESPSYGKNFTTDVTLANVTDLYGFEFKLYWNTTLLDLVDVNITPPWIEHTPGTNQINETIGRYWVGVSALGPSPSFNGSTTLVALTFKITDVPVYPEHVNCTFDLNETILGDPDGKSIPHVVYDGEYWCYAARAKIQVLPQVSEAKALHQVFNLSINVANVANIHTFEFTLQYNTTHLDANEITVTSFPDRTYKVSKKILDDTQGLVTLRVESISPSLQVNESLELAIITFEVTNATTWLKPSIESDFSFGFTELITDTGAVDHDKIEGLYRYTPIPGDINGDGIVNIMDLATVARAYGTKPGDLKWNELVDVNNDNIINILDLIPVARNYGRTD